MKNLFLFSMLVVGSLAIRIESAPASHTIAILPFDENKGEGKNPVMNASDKQQLLETIRGIARRNLPKADGWKVISYNAVEAKVGADLSSCNGEEGCLLSAGRKLPADYIVTADVGRIGSYIEVSFSLFDVANGQVIGSEWPRGKTVDDIIDSLESNPDRLFATLSEPYRVRPSNPSDNSQSGEVQNAQVQPAPVQTAPDTQVILDDPSYYDGSVIVAPPYYYGSPYYYWGGSSWIYYGGGHGYYHGGGGFHGGHGGGFHGRR